MRYSQVEQVEIIVGSNPADFKTELNNFLRKLAEQGMKHELQFSPQTGLVAYVRYWETFKVAETKSEEYEIKGELHCCGECPFWILPTDGRVKYTGCQKHFMGAPCKDTWCCDEFYEMLEKGEIEIREVMQFGKGKKKKTV